MAQNLLPGLTRQIYLGKGPAALDEDTAIITANDHMAEDRLAACVPWIIVHMKVLPTKLHDVGMPMELTSSC